MKLFFVNFELFSVWNAQLSATQTTKHTLVIFCLLASINSHTVLPFLLLQVCGEYIKTCKDYLNS